MTECCRRVPARSRPWLLWGVVLVAVLLAHDTLMALEAVATPHADRNGAQHAMAEPEAKGASPPAAHFATDAQHPAECGVGFSAVLRRSDVLPEGEFTLTPLGSMVLHSSTAPSHTIIVPWREPHWPPGTLRALSQVYRI